MPATYVFNETTGHLEMMGTSGSDGINNINYNLTRPDLKTTDIKGRGGKDIITTEGSDDLLYGGSGADTLNGRTGTNSLYGGAGNDVLTGRTKDASQALFGGDGNDRVIVNLSADSEDIAPHNFNGGNGSDSLTLSADDIAGSRIYLHLQEGYVGRLSGGTIAPMADVFNFETITFFDAANAYGSSKGETLRGSSYDDRLHGLGGKDTIIGNVGNDRIWGGGGDDVLFDDSEGTVASPYDFQSQDRVYGGTGKDFLVSKGGDDTLYGGDQADVLISLEGKDTIFGGRGNDDIAFLWYPDAENGPRLSAVESTKFVRRSDESLNGISIDGGLGTDWITFERLGFLEVTPGKPGTSQAAPLVADLATGRFELKAQYATPVLKVKNVEDVTGTYSSDIIQGNGKNNLLIGLHGNDTLVGRGGQDELFGDAGDDAIAGGDGLDYLVGGEGRDKIDGGNQADILKGGAGKDLLLGRKGADGLYGGEGNDTIVGGQGRDVIFGGAGSDTFVLRRGDGVDVIDDFSPTKTAQDKLWLKGMNTNIAGLTLIEVNPGQQDPIFKTVSLESGTWVIASIDAKVFLTGVFEGQLGSNDFIF